MIRAMPHAPDAEMALLGSMLLDCRAIDDTAAIVPSAECYHSETHATIHAAIVGLYAKHKAIDLVQLEEVLRGRGVLDAVGGLAYLVRIAEGVPTAVNALHYARIVRDKWIKRRIIDAATDAAVRAGEDDAPAAELLDSAQAAMLAIDADSGGGEAADLSRLIGTIMEEYDQGGVLGVMTGFIDLDNLTNGFKRGELTIVAGRPSMGKTSWAMQAVVQASRLGQVSPGTGEVSPIRVAVYSLEMDAKSLAVRLITSGAQVDSWKYGRALLSKEEYARVLTAQNQLADDAPIIIDTPGLTLNQLRASVRRLKRKHPTLAIVMVDYLQLIAEPKSAKENRLQEVSSISRGLKLIAKESGVHVLAVSQMNRDADKRDGHRPRLSDLRDSGTIEQDADNVIFIHREEYYHAGDAEWAAENPDLRGVAELIVAKQRNGATGSVMLRWDGKTTTFSNRATREREAA